MTLPPPCPSPPRRSPPPRRPTQADTGLWALSALALADLLLAALCGAGHHSSYSLSLFFLGLALPAEALPVTGPRGRRIGAGDGLGWRRPCCCRPCWRRCRPWSAASCTGPRGRRGRPGARR